MDTDLPSRNPNISLPFIWILELLSDLTKASSMQTVQTGKQTTCVPVMSSNSHQETVLNMDIKIEASLLLSSGVETCRIWGLKWTLEKTEESAA